MSLAAPSLLFAPGQSRSQSPARPLVQPFRTELPADTAFVGPAFKLLQGYSGVPAWQVEDHLKKIRDKAWAIHPYGCIGLWRFLDLYFSRTPEYREVLARVRAGAVFLDVGCCLGQTLRQLAWDGAPAKSLAGVDLHQAFIDLGYELFRDRGRVDVDGSGEERPMRFAAGDVLADDDPPLRALDGAADIVNASNLFHLFAWDDQVRAACRIVRFLRKPRRSRSPLGWRLGGSSGRGAGAGGGGEGRRESSRTRGARGSSPFLEPPPQPVIAGGPVVVGRQLGDREPLSREAHEAKGLRRYFHNPDTLQRLWDEVGERTNSRWKVWAEMLDVPRPMNGGEAGENGAGQGGLGAAAAQKTTTVIRYIIRRVD